MVFWMYFIFEFRFFWDFRSIVFGRVGVLKNEEGGFLGCFLFLMVFSYGFVGKIFKLLFCYIVVGVEAF